MRYRIVLCVSAPLEESDPSRITSDRVLKPPHPGIDVINAKNHVIGDCSHEALETLGVQIGQLETRPDQQPTNQSLRGRFPRSWRSNKCRYQNGLGKRRKEAMEQADPE